MKVLVRFLVVFALVLGLAACSTSSNPGPLAGTWQFSGMPMTVTFREGETEAMGMIEKVSYKQEGNDVLVTNLNGLAKGTTFHYTFVDANTVRSQLGTLRRIR